MAKRVCDSSIKSLQDSDARYLARFGVGLATGLAGAALLMAGCASSTPAQETERSRSGSAYPLAPEDPEAQLPLNSDDYPPEPSPATSHKQGKNGEVKRTVVVGPEAGSKPKSQHAVEDVEASEPGAGGNPGATPPVEQTAEPFPGILPVRGSTDGLRPSENMNEIAGPGMNPSTMNVIKDSVPWKAAPATKLFINWPNGQTGGCSGALVGTKTVLTAGHCLYNPARGGWASAISVVPALDQQYMPYGKANMVYPMADAEWVNSQDNDYDWGIIYTDRYIGSTATAGHYGVASLSDSTWNSPLLVEMFGYPGSVAGGIRTVNSVGAETCVDSTMVYHNADSADGMSGAGLTGWAYYSDYVSAVHSGTGYNLGCSFSEMKTSTRINSFRLSWIQSHLDDPAYWATEQDDGIWEWHEGFPSAPVGMVSAYPNDIDMYIRGTDGAVWMQRLQSGSWVPSKTSWTWIGGSVLGKVAAVSRSTNQVDLFIRQNSGGMAVDEPTPVCTKARYLSSWWPSASTWSCFTDFSTLEWPSATAPNADTLHVFGVSSNGHVQLKRWTAQGGWVSPIDLGGNTQHPVSVVKRQYNYWDAFIRDASTGQICTKSWNGTSFWPSQGSWYCMANSEIDGEPTAASYSTSALDVFGIRNGNAKRMYWRGSSWEGPTDLGGGGNLGGTVQAVSRTSNQLDIFVRYQWGETGPVYTKTLTGSTWGPSQTGWWTLEGDGIDVSAVATGGKLHVVNRSQFDLAVRHRWWDGSTWRP